MPTPIVPRFCDHFADLPDPRLDRTTRHALLDIVTIAICAVIGGADTWADVERCGHAKVSWCRTFLAVPHGIPSHDTFGRIERGDDPAAFKTAFLGWVQTLAGVTDGAVVAIVGGCGRRRTPPRAPLRPHRCGTDALRPAAVTRPGRRAVYDAFGKHAKPGAAVRERGRERRQEKGQPWASTSWFRS